MDMTGICDLLQTIAVHYPSFRQHITDKSGKLHAPVAQEWYRMLGWMDTDDALRRFDEYMAQPDGNRFAPDVKWFLQQKNQILQRKSSEWQNPQYNFDRLDRHGRLTDAEGRLYAFPDRPDELYHYDTAGRILDSKNNLVR